MTSHDAQLRARTDDLARAVDLAGDRLDPGIADQMRDAIAGVRQRLALGVDHTVVAFAGGTGSGKSSLFNRITRLDFADVGAKRPTTARVTACAWSEDATALLDWLEVDVERRITREGELDSVDESKFGGLVLLDLPDHDSIESAHREVVDRVLPLVDLLVWVVDPQKYADDALHSGYLRKSQGLEGSMVVAVNHIDTVPQATRLELVADMGRLLEQDGLTGVYVTMVSAVTGEGLEDVRRLLEQAVARRSVAAGRVAGELDRAGLLLLEETPGEVPRTMTQAVEQEVAAVADACGVDAVAGQVGAAVRRGYGHPEFAAPAPEALALSRARWVTRAGRHLRPGWREALESSVESSGMIAAELRRALAALPLDTRGPASARATRRSVLAVSIVALVALVGGVLTQFGVLAAPASVAPAAWAVAAVSLVVAVAVFFAGRRARSNLARRREEQVRRAALEAIERVIQESMGEPTQVLLDDHRRVRELAQEARDSDRSSPLAGALRLPTADSGDSPSTESPTPG